MFGLLGLQQRARELFRRAVAVRPDVPQYLFNLAAAEQMIGALGDAEAPIVTQSIACDPRDGLAHYAIGPAHPEPRPQPYRREGSPASCRTAIGAERNHAALGKECEDLARWDCAFDHVEAGCNLQHRSLPRSPAEKLGEIDAIIDAHTRSWIEAAPRGCSEAAAVFVTGLPRTGTTLVERIIASHSAMHSVGKTSAFAAEMRRAMTQRPSGRDSTASAGAIWIRPPRFAYRTASASLTRRWITIFYCGLIHAALPSAKIILVQRHPMDACWAIYKAHFRDKFAVSYHQTELADYYLAYRRVVRRWRRVLPAGALVEMNYEDIVRDQAAASRDIIRFLGLPWEDGVMRFHESPAPSATASAVQVRRPIYASSVGEWRHHAVRLRPLRERLAREIPEAKLV